MIKKDSINSIQIQKTDSVEKDSIVYKEISRTSSNFNAVNEILINTDRFEYKTYISNEQTIKTNNVKYKLDSTIFHYKTYDISIVISEGDVGELIRFNNHKNNIFIPLEKYYNYGALYFKGIVGDKLIIDSGTSASRGLAILDLKNLKIVLDAGYSGNLIIMDKTIKFDCQLNNNDLKDKSKLPTCPESNAYFQEQTFDLIKDLLIRSGEIHCEYVE